MACRKSLRPGIAHHNGDDMTSTLDMREHSASAYTLRCCHGVYAVTLGCGRSDPLEAGLFFDGQLVVDLLDAVNRTGNLDCPVHLLRVAYETAELHFAFLGFDIDVGALDIGIG